MKINLCSKKIIGAILGLSLFAGAAMAKKTNILFIFIDDCSTIALNAYAPGCGIHTPNIDSLSNDGMTFKNAYIMGSWLGAVCKCSRTCLNTGMNVWRAKVADEEIMPDIVKRGELWSQMMKKAGYKTYMTGKWHLPNSAAPSKVFDKSEFVRDGMPKDQYYKKGRAGYDRPIQGTPDKWDPSDPKFGGYWEGGKHWSEVTADCAVKYISDNAKSEQPLFMYIAFNAPHDPRQSPKKYVDMYPTELMKVPVNFEDENEYSAALRLRDIRDETLAPYPRTPYAVRTHLREYYGIITHLDVQIGRILKQLKDSGLEDDTIVFFTADNGLSLGEHGFFGKQNMYENSVKVPLVVRGKNIKANSTVDDPIYMQSIMPTTLEIAGEKVPDFVEYDSILPVIKGEAKPEKKDIYCTYKTKESSLLISLRRGDMKLICYPQIKTCLLYDLSKDPHEMNNLAENPDYKDTLETMRRDLLRIHADKLASAKDLEKK